MPNGTDQPPDQPTPTTWLSAPGRVLSEPGTVAQCRADYEAAADVRRTCAAQQARARRHGARR